MPVDIWHWYTHVRNQKTQWGCTGTLSLPNMLLSMVMVHEKLLLTFTWHFRFCCLRVFCLFLLSFVYYSLLWYGEEFHCPQCLVISFCVDLIYLQRVVDTYWIDYAVLKRWCSWGSPSCFSLSFFLFLFWVFSFLFCAFVLFFIYIFFSSLFFCVHLSSWSSSSSILALTCWASQHYSWNVPWRLVLWQRVSMLVHMCHWPTVRKVMNSIGCHGICLILGIQVSENACDWCWV